MNEITIKIDKLCENINGITTIGSFSMSGNLKVPNVGGVVPDKKLRLSWSLEEFLAIKDVGRNETNLYIIFCFYKIKLDALNLIAYIEINYLRDRGKLEILNFIAPQYVPLLRNIPL